MTGGVSVTTETWENRIVGEGEVPPDQLLANPENWRIHPKEQQDALEAMLGGLGWIQRIVVNQRSGHVVDGHLRAALAISREQPTVPVLYVDLDDDQERMALATLDPLSAMAVADATKFVEVLSTVAQTDYYTDLAEAGKVMLADLLEANAPLAYAEREASGAHYAEHDRTPSEEPRSPLRLVQLLYEDEEYDRFMAAVATLQKASGVTPIRGIVLAAVERAAG